MLGMRLSEGVDATQIAQAWLLAPAIADTFQELIALGLVKYRDGRYRPTSKGWLLGNELYGRIWALAEQDDRKSSVPDMKRPLIDGYLHEV
jgi:oxygen-independent coproporphyrinogen-3 oxidase